jgi:TPR repeat protein
MRAAKGGVVEAQYALADCAWAASDYLKFLLWALPLAQDIERRNGKNSTRRQACTKNESELLERCAQALLMTSDPNSRLIEHYLRVAAEGGQSSAQLAYGLWIARMDENGNRLKQINGVAHYKKGIRWLSQAGEKGEARASYALSRIFLKPEFSRRSVGEARKYLEMAASGGHVLAQIEMGLVAWRHRRLDPRSDIKAVYWLLKAAGSGSEEAQKLLDKIVPPIRKAEWAHIAKKSFTREMISQYPFLAARIELGYLFGLTRAEALLIDVQTADHGHCLEIDIREQHPRSRRRLIPILTGDQRQAVDHAARVFDTVDGNAITNEGNYRQRLYRFRSLMTTRRDFNGAGLVRR